LKITLDSGDRTTTVTLRKEVIGKMRKRPAISRMETLETAINLKKTMTATVTRMRNLQRKRRKRKLT